MASHNMTWMTYPSQSRDSLTSIEDIIFSQHVISRLMHSYIAVFVPIGLLSGIIILGVFIQNFVQRTFEKLDVLLFAYTLSNVFMILFSLTITARPAYLRVSYLECGTLSFFFNLNYFSSQYLLCLMVLTFLINKRPPRSAFLSKVHQNPIASTGFVLTGAFCVVLIVAAMLGIESYHAETDCQLDPLFAWPEYEIIKFLFGFCVPSLAELLCFILPLVQGMESDAHPSRQDTHSFWTVLVVSLTTFVFRLFYNVMILCRTRLKMQRSIGTAQNELAMNIAEVLLFGESCISLVIVLFLHPPCRTGLLNLVKKLTAVCRRGHSTNRAPEIPEVSLGAPELGSP